MGMITNAAGTLLGPLTTVWTPPASCTVNLAPYDTKSFIINRLYQGQQCVTGREDNGFLEDNYRCWPSPEGDFVEPKHPYLGWGYYSPGLECPAGYTSACSATAGGKSNWDVEFALRPRETAVGCCPENYSCANINGNTCYAIATAPIEATTGECDGTKIGRSELVTITADEGFASATDDSLTTTLYAPLYQLNYQSTDLETRPTSTSDPGPTSRKSNGSKSTDGADETDEKDSTNDTSEGLSTAAKAGIGVGAAVGALALAGALFWYFWVMRKRRARGGLESNGGAYSKPPMAGDEASHFGFGAGYSAMHELDDGPRAYEMPLDHRDPTGAELDASSYGAARVEMDNTQVAVEMPAPEWSRTRHAG